jgi:acyl carrier protein
MAQEKGLGWVDIHFTPSPRNQPAHDFLESVGAPFRQSNNGGLLFRFPARIAAQIQFDPQSDAAETPPPSSEKAKPEIANGSPVAMPSGLPRFKRFREIALGFNCAEKIHERFESKSAVKQGSRTGFVAPANDLEKQLCALWQKLLRVSEVGVKDNFFELGGHSLLAVRLFSEIEKLTGHKLPLVSIFQSPTIRKLARALSHTETNPNNSLLVPLQPKGSRTPLFLVHQITRPGPARGIRNAGSNGRILYQGYPRSATSWSVLPGRLLLRRECRL